MSCHQTTIDNLRPLSVGRRGLVCLALIVTPYLSGCYTLRDYRARHRLNSGQALLAEDDLEAALAEFQAAAELAPQMAVAHSKMGTIYRRMGEYELAINAFVEAIRRDPFSFQDTFDLAQLYQFTDRIKDAVLAYLHAVELKPDSFDAQLNLGTCYQQLGDNSQAIERFEQAIEIDPSRPYPYVNLGVAFDAQKNYYEAIRAYKEALERDNRQPVVLVNLAHTYMNQDRLKMARQALRTALDMDTELAAGHEALGYCLFRMRDFDSAEVAYERALECNWRLPRAHAGLGSINMLRYLEDNTKTELHERAREHWHRSLELNPEQPRIRKLLAKYQPKQRDPEQALLDETASP
ncbi:MAG: tetratricopeptide repeat protein [Phycisphaerales bacterium]|nr:MAG: tetratricopeptide repeat protein [Phycisphaerales bacterium]